MDERLICKDLRKRFGQLSWVLLIYYGIMNVLVSIVDIVDVVLRSVNAAVRLGATMVPEMLMQIASQTLAQNGWGYLLTVLVGLVILWLWKGRTFCTKDLFTKGKPMSVWAFTGLLCIFTGSQLVFDLLASGLEWLLNLFGLSAQAATEMATMSAHTLSMFLYLAIFAPIGEEILFRGLILRSLMPYGKRFAILASSFLFGIFHGNLMQTPYAFGVGLLLGFVAAEYSVLWAMVLHIFNNLVLADMLPRLTASLPDVAVLMIEMIIMGGAVIGAVIVLIVKRWDIAAWFREGKPDRLCVKSFFTAPGTIVLTTLMVCSMLLTLVLG